MTSVRVAPALVGASRETCRTYISHFLRSWSHRKDAFDDALEALRRSTAFHTHFTYPDGTPASIWFSYNGWAAAAARALGPDAYGPVAVLWAAMFLDLY